MHIRGLWASALALLQWVAPFLFETPDLRHSGRGEKTSFMA